ncbi:hypothetical protein M0805_001316 [Coniferiporia weirii]|nr:hypothetical protein M0805_001316 [Coniferiporia weirii]
MAKQLAWISALLFSLFIYALTTPYYAPGPEFLGHHTRGPSDTTERLRILLLTAHPDDECMFFAPTLFALARNAVVREPGYVAQDVRTTDDLETRTDVYSLCLSSGDADGLGETRKVELEASLDVLGVEKGRRWVLDEPFKDNITMFWDAQLVADYVRPYLLEHKIDIVLTFDGHGISSHPNHISLARGARVLVSDPPSRSLRAFSLKTTGLLPKYTGAGAALFTKFRLAFCASPLTLWELDTYPQLTPLLELASPVLRALKAAGCPAHEEGESASFVSGWTEYARALRAMRAHESQLVWFRWLYVGFSRYLWVNTWDEIVAESS